jgi:hypothetical protein
MSKGHTKGDVQMALSPSSLTFANTQLPSRLPMPRSRRHYRILRGPRFSGHQVQGFEPAQPLTLPVQHSCKDKGHGNSAAKYLEQAEKQAPQRSTSYSEFKCRLPSLVLQFPPRHKGILAALSYCPASRLRAFLLLKKCRVTAQLSGASHSLHKDAAVLLASLGSCAALG